MSEQPAGRLALQRGLLEQEVKDLAARLEHRVSILELGADRG